MIYKIAYNKKGEVVSILKSGDVTATITESPEYKVTEVVESLGELIRENPAEYVFDHKTKTFIRKEV